MKFLVLMAEADHFARWDRSTDAEQQAAFDSMAAFTAAVCERGQILAGEALSHEREARTLRAGHEQPASEGPYAETVEQIGGFFLVELPDLDIAVDLARLLPAAWTIEVRPVVDVG